MRYMNISQSILSSVTLEYKHRNVQTKIQESLYFKPLRRYNCCEPEDKRMLTTPVIGIIFHKLFIIFVQKIQNSLRLIYGECLAIVLHMTDFLANWVCCLLRFVLISVFNCTMFWSVLRIEKEKFVLLAYNPYYFY